jgi:hypothetical protein
MTESSPNNEYMEAFPLQEGSILLEAENKPQTLRQLTITALKKVINDRNLDLPLAPQLDLDNPQRILKLNRFFVQVVTTGINSDEVSIPLKEWSKRDCAPQLLLAAKVDDENNIVYFPGVLTGPELKELISNQLDNQNEISLSVDNFDGGIDRLLRLVRLLQPSAIPRTALIEKPSSKLFPLKPIQLGALGLIALGAFSLRPNPSYQFASKWSNDQTLIALSTIQPDTSLRSINNLDSKKVCLLSPAVTSLKDKLNSVAVVSFDRPIIYSPDPLNEIVIQKEGSVVWRERASSQKNITGPIVWPIASIQPDKKYEISFRSQNALAGEYAKIRLEIDSSKPFVSLNSFIEKLGDDKSKWISIVDEKLEENKQLGLALLFSNKAPKIKPFMKLKTYLEETPGCSVSEPQ